MKKILSFLLAAVMVLSMSLTVFAEDTVVATISEKTYTSLQAAINDAVNGDTIVLQTDCSETVTVVQKANVKITIDGNDKNMTGTITVNGKSSAYDTAGLTIKKVNFTAASNSVCINMGVSGDDNTRYISNLSVETCTFIGTDKTAVAIKSYTGGDKNLTITGCTATGMHSLVQLANVTNVNINNCTITEGKNGISVGLSTLVEIDKATINVTGYGIRGNTESDDATNADMTVKNSTISADKPIVVRELDDNSAYELSVTGCNLTASNSSGQQVVLTSGDDGDEPAAPAGTVTATITGGNVSKVYPETITIVPVEPEEETPDYTDDEDEEEDLVSVTAKILWDGKAVSDGVDVKLLRNDKRYETKTLTAGKQKHLHWRHTWSELDPEEDWTIEVIVPDGYECDIDEYGDNDYEITLTQIEVSVPVSDTVEEVNPNTGAI